MEQKYSAAPDQIFALRTDPKWLEARSLALGELSASVKARKSGGAVALTIKRRVRRDLPALLSKVISPESEWLFDEQWSASAGGAGSGTLAMLVEGQPLKMDAEFELLPSGSGSVYRIEHRCESGVPLIGGAVAKFAQGQVEQGCAAEFAYRVDYLKNST